MTFDMVQFANGLLANATRMPTPACCATCAQFDGDTHCTLPKERQMVTGAVVRPREVCCALYVPAVMER
jgi:hypothetical protein